MGARCDKHGVALAPDGRCMLCVRRSSRPAPAERSLGAQVINGVLLSGIAASLGLLAAWWAAPDLIASLWEVRASRAPHVAAAIASPPRRTVGAQRSDQAPDPPPAVIAPEPAFADRAPTEPARDPVPDPALDAERRAEAQRDRERSEMVAAQIRERELSADRRGVSVVMYSTRWCGVCRRAREFLDRESIAYVEHDVDADASAKQRMRRLNPRGGVPTFDVAGEVLVGFSDTSLLAAIDRAATSRSR